MQQIELFGQDRELLIGPAGCGKTQRILELYLAELEAGRERQVLLLVPTASFREHTRNTVLRSGRVRAFRGDSVATFDNLQPETGEELTSARRELLVRRLLRELDLPYLRNVASYAGFRETLAEEAEEVLAAGLTAKDLERRTKASPRRDAFLKFLRAYEAATTAFRRACEIQTKYRVLLVDGFTDFTAEQQRLLRGLVESAERSVVTLPHDGDVARKFLLGLGFRETVMQEDVRASGSLQGLERALREGGDGTPPLQDDGTITVFTAADRRDEVDLVAREILRLVRDYGYRCQDIGVIVENAAAYLPLLRDQFRRSGIPVRLFFPTAASDTALGRHLLACLDLYRKRDAARPEAVLAVLKSPYSPVLRQEAVERFECAVMKRRAQAEQGDWKACLGPNPFPPLEKFFADLERYEKELQACSDARALASWTARLWRDFTLFREIPPGRSHPRALELRADARAWRQAWELPAEIAAAAEAEKEALDFPAFAELLAGQIAQARFRVRDRRQDAVNVMNAYEARQWELGAVFVVGMVEKEFPRPAGQALFLEDGERQGLSLSTSADRAREERRLFYVAATRAKKRLTLSHPHTDGRGMLLLKSFFLEDVERLLPASARMQAPSLVAAGSPAPPPASHGDRLQLPAVIESLREKQVSFSASRFREFGQCPFKHFAAHVLRLEGLPKEAQGLTPLLQGNIVHDSLREWETGGRSEPIGRVLDRCFEKNTQGIPIAHEEQKLRNQMRDDLERFAALEAQHDSVYRTRVDPALVEKKFGGADGPVLEWTLQDGSKIQITGRLDRVETAQSGRKRLGVVVDFKYSREGFEPKRLKKVEEGQEFQIPLYLLALEELFELEPAGAELYALRGEPRRTGIFHQDLARAVFCGQPPPDSTLPPAEFRKMLQTARKWMEDYAARIRAGEIAVRPHDTEECRKGKCEFYDLCRVDKWQFTKG